MFADTSSGLSCSKANYYYIWKMIERTLIGLRASCKKDGLTSEQTEEKLTNMAYAITERSDVNMDAALCVRDQIADWVDSGVENAWEWRWECCFATPDEIAKSAKRKEAAGGSYNKFPSQFR